MSILVPDYIFEASWEVCNRVGGIYTVLSTKAASLVSRFGQNMFFVGPDVWHEVESPFFIPDKDKFSEWVSASEKEGLHVRVGNWDIPGKPLVILVDFRSFYQRKIPFMPICGIGLAWIRCMPMAIMTSRQCLAMLAVLRLKVFSVSTI